MPPRRKHKQPSTTEADVTEGLPASERIARLLALMVVRGMETEDAALKLDAVSFSAHDISGLLGVNANYVHNAKYRKKGSAKKKAKKAAS